MNETQQFTCEQCGSSFDISFPEIIDAQKNPSEADDVKTGSIFLKSCPECGHKNLILWEFFYKDTEKGYALHLCEKNGTHKPGLKDSFLRQRIVYEPVEMIEKIFIFDQGLDDRVIEIMKLMNLLVVSEDKDIEISDIIFSPDEDGNNHFLILSEGEEYGTTAFSQDMYDDVKETFIANLSPEYAVSERVDATWALHAVRKDQMLS